jgi:long-subunit fatty acid transport protein
MPRIVVIAFLCFTWLGEAHAQVAGSFSVLRLDASPRAAAMAGSVGAQAPRDVQTMFYNPALVSPEMASYLSLAYLNHIGDLNAGFTAYARDVEGIGTIAGGLRFLSWGSTERTDEDGVTDGSFGASDVALSLAVGRAYADNIRIGAAIHAVTSGIDNHRASAVAADVGATYRLAASGITAGLSVHHVGLVMSSLGDDSDALPTDLRLTLSGRLQHLPLFITVTGRNLHDPGRGPENLEGFSMVMRHMAFGGEFQFSDSFQLRFGYNHQRQQDLKMSSRLDMAGVGLGFGLRVNRFLLDYAFNSWSTLGGLHQLGVSTRI